MRRRFSDLYYAATDRYDTRDLAGFFIMVGSVALFLAMVFLMGDAGDGGTGPRPNPKPNPLPDKPTIPDAPPKEWRSEYVTR